MKEFINVDSLDRYETLTEGQDKFKFAIKTILSAYEPTCGVRHEKDLSYEGDDTYEYSYELKKNGLIIGYYTYRYIHKDPDEVHEKAFVVKDARRPDKWYGSLNILGYKTISGEWQSTLQNLFYKSREKLKKQKTKTIGQKKNG